MPESTPYVASGLCEALDIFVIQQLRTLYGFYTSELGESLKIDVKAVWTKGDVSSYPFVGVMSHIPRVEPTFIDDDLYTTPDTLFRTAINECKIHLGLQAVELRELARLREFTIYNLERGNNPLNQASWRQWFLAHNVNILYWDIDEPEQVDFRTLQMRTRMAQGEERMDRTDIETLWIQDVTICSQVQFNVPMVSTNGVISGFKFTFQIDDSF